MVDNFSVPPMSEASCRVVMTLLDKVSHAPPNESNCETPGLSFFATKLVL